MTPREAARGSCVATYMAFIYDEDMKSLLVQLDESTYRALSQIVPPASRGRARFIREAVKRAVREAEYARIRRAYEARPDSETEADDWANAEAYKP